MGLSSRQTPSMSSERDACSCGRRWQHSSSSIRRRFRSGTTTSARRTNASSSKHRTTSRAPPSPGFASHRRESAPRQAGPRSLENGGRRVAVGQRGTVATRATMIRRHPSFCRRRFCSRMPRSSSSGSGETARGLGLRESGEGRVRSPPVRPTSARRDGVSQGRRDADGRPAGWDSRLLRSRPRNGDGLRRDKLLSTRSVNITHRQSPLGT